MYTLKLSYGDVDEPETATVEVLGTYESLDEACEAAATTTSHTDTVIASLAAYLGSTTTGSMSSRLCDK